MLKKKTNDLNKFQIPAGHPGIRNDLIFVMNSPLAVITGVNGSGKTSLLRFIYNQYSDGKSIFFKTQSVNKNADKVHLRPGYYRKQESDIPTFDSVMDDLYTLFLRAHFNKYRRTAHRYDFFTALFDSASRLYHEFGTELLEAVCKELSTLEDIDKLKKKLGVPTERQIKKDVIRKLNDNANPYKDKHGFTRGARFYNSVMGNYSTYVPRSPEYRLIEQLEEESKTALSRPCREKSAINSRESFYEYVHALVLNYSFSIESIIEKVEKRIYEDSKGKTTKRGHKLWQKINDEIKKNHKNHFKYTINPPTEYSSKYEISFKTDDKKDVHFDSLSSGQKVIFELLCYYLIANQDGELKLIILDEFDANLNPTLVDEYINTIKRQFCAEGINVILTTHSPSTVAALDPQDIFELSIEGTTQQLICAKNEKGKQSILKKLAPKFVYYSEFGNLEYVLKDSTNRIVLLEGRHDNDNFKNNTDYTFVPCNGAGNITNLLRCFHAIDFFKKILENKLLIALYDFDKKGRESIKNLLDASYDDQLTIKIENKQWPYVYCENSNYYVATFTPLQGDDWDYKNNPIEHRKLKENTLLNNQEKLLLEIVNDWNARNK